jgi:hypothetical protein
VLVLVLVLVLEYGRAERCGVKMWTGSGGLLSRD